MSATGEILYVNKQAGRAYFAWDQSVTLIDADGNVLVSGMMLLTLDGAKALDPASQTQWKMLPGVQASYNAALTYQVVPDFQRQAGTTVLLVSGQGFDVVSNNPNTRPAEFVQEQGTQNSYLIWETPAEHPQSSFPASDYLNALVYNAADQMPTSPITEPFPVLHFGQVVAKDIDRAAFFYGPGGRTVDPVHGANGNGGMITLQTLAGQTVYAGGFLGN